MRIHKVLAVLAALGMWLAIVPSVLAQDQRPESDGELWRELASQRFIIGDVTGALEAWNEIGEPRVERVTVEGLVYTRRSVVMRYLGLEAGDLFTPARFEQVERRLQELPVASRTRLRYDPVSGGGAWITPIVAEREVVASDVKGWALVATRAVIAREIQMDISGRAGRGELWSASYRYPRNRPGVQLRFQAPAPGGLPGLLHAEAFWERQTYQSLMPDQPLFNEQRIRAAAGLSDWTTSWLRLSGSAALDRIGTTTYAAAEGSASVHVLGDLVALTVKAGRWFAPGGASSFARAQFVAAVRSTADERKPVLSAAAGVGVAGNSAPLALWLAGNASNGRGVLLRAHPLREHDIVTSEVFGRRLFFATGEYEYPLPTGFGTLGLAGFVDLARAERRAVPTPSAFHVDIGGGIRFHGSAANGSVRMDVAYGIRDGNVQVSAGYVPAWGRGW